MSSQAGEDQGTSGRTASTRQHTRLAWRLQSRYIIAAWWWRLPAMRPAACRWNGAD